MSLRLVLADDNYLVREGMRRLLDEGDEVTTVGTAASAPALLLRVRDLRPDVVLTDIRMPPTFTTDGITAALQLRAEHPDVGVVVLSQHADASYASALFAQGTGGLAYLLKDRVGDREELIRALEAVHTGGSVVDPQVVDALLAAGRRAAGSPVRDLSQREVDVLRGMAEGRTNGAIAASLHVSESAVSKHVASVFAKLGLHESPDTDRRVRAVLTWVEHRPGPGA
ncbi:response regulator transcription factor [Blastococcus saxobsidens]|uniref:Two component response regulator containing a CheY-like receiver domain and an HTH DNA-binding domain n=1 Tax=Blastococcus saxobsidens (strain DD2) TaxID=1146883 RepID=H6RX93_BLASD|nr:response regulator transcription factor [Blastococcus saxobsidens]CCG04704.1 Two component response regulator containing a CheY-like receiver domain and an HTH DNA-binding domain [Blastococcus saxobsidens DD2]